MVMYHQPSALPGVGGAYLYQWNDDRCNMKHNFICKYAAGEVPVPAHVPAPVSSNHLSFTDVRGQGDTGGGRSTGEASPARTGDAVALQQLLLLSPEATAGGGVAKADGEDVPSQVTTPGSSGTLLLYLIIPTIPLFLLILVASGTCCFQLLRRR